MQFGGGYNYNRFKPRFIEPEEFQEKKKTDGYIKFIWSFGNNGQQYLFGPDNIDVKREAHNFIVFGKPTIHFKELEKFVKSKDIHTRKAQFQKAVKMFLKRRGDLQTLEMLHRLQNLQTLERLHRDISFETGSYKDYTYHPGDVVYCDPPYEGTAKYSTAFNSQEFYEWVKSRPYPVFFSSYQGVKGFRMLWAKRLLTPYGQGNSSVHFECLYTNQ